MQSVVCFECLFVDIWLSMYTYIDVFGCLFEYDSCGVYKIFFLRNTLNVNEEKQAVEVKKNCLKNGM